MPPARRVRTQLLAVVISHSSTCGGTEFVPCRAGMYSSTCVGTVYSAGISIFLRFSAIPGSEQIRPLEGAFSRPPLAESVIDARSFAGASEGCCVGRASRHREAAGGRVEHGTRSCFLGNTMSTKIFSKIHLDTNVYEYITSYYCLFLGEDMISVHARYDIPGIWYHIRSIIVPGIPL